MDGDPHVLEQMRADWNRRATEDANYYVAFGRRDQGEDEFFASGAGEVQNLERELKRLARRDAALEIGCGPGRLMRPMSRHFREIHGVDVSDEMIRLARERLRGCPNAFAHHNSGSDLARFPAGSFDFVYSYAVFQHIPSAEVVFGYLREARRVLKPGGVLRCQLNGLPQHARRYDTWSGVRISPGQVVEFARGNGLQLLALEQVWTQYMWMTCRKPAPSAATGPVALRNISNAHTGEAATPAAGALAAISLWIQNLPESSDLATTKVTADGRPCRLTFIGPAEKDGVSQVNATLPEGIRTGLVLVDAFLDGRPLCAGWTRILPAPPPVPRIAAVTDGINLLSGAFIQTRSVKVALFETREPGEFRAAVDGVPVEFEAFCTDPVALRYEFNFNLPPHVGAGRHELRIGLGKRQFPPLSIEVA